MKTVNKTFRMLKAFLMITPVFFGGNAFATTFLSENWETGTPPAGWPCKTAPSSCTRSSYNGWSNVMAEYCPGNSDWAQTGISTARTHGGAKSFYMQRAHTASCDIRKDIPSPYPSKVYVRFYLYLDSNFINFDTPTTRFPIYHFLFTNSAFSQTGLRINIMTGVPYGTGQCGSAQVDGRPYAFFLPQDYDYDWRNGTYSTCYNLLDHLNEWQAVEFMFDAPNDTVTIWMNGKQIYTARDRITDGSFNMFQFSSYMSDADGPEFAAGYYIDDIVVSDSYIGPTGDTGTGLGTPLNLRTMQ